MDKTGAVALCGFMGCGKSTLGRRAARLLGREFADLDGAIEAAQGMTVSEIFARFGEAGFRRMETEALRSAAQRGDTVLALGGGTVLFPQNVQTLRDAGALVVLLDAPLALVQRRLRYDTRRPLLQVPDRERVIAELYRQRTPLYRAAADVVFPVSDIAPGKNAARLARQVRERVAAP